VARVSQTPDTSTTYDVRCPHCNKNFKAEPASGPAARYTGFKCPHCRLFVPFERADEQGRVEATD
jgi:phage FluMu protein Com